MQTAVRKHTRGEQQIPLERIQSDAVKLRPLDEDRIQDLMSSFRSKGQQQPIKVRPNGGYSFLVVFGEHRLAAASRLGWREIRATVEEVDELEALELKVTENIQRNHYTDPFEEGKIYARLLDERYVHNLNALAESIGKRTSYISDRLTVYYQLVPSLRQYVGKELTTGNAISIAKLQDQVKQVQVAEAVIKTRTQSASTAWGSSSGGGPPPMGVVKVRPFHSCSCGCGDIHPVRNVQPVSVDVDVPGAGRELVLGLVRRDQGYVHIENPGAEGNSYCGYELASRWSAELPEDVDTRTFRTGDGQKVCDNCAKPWRRSC